MEILKIYAESGYYPPGTEYDSDAPWNETENEDWYDEFDGEDFYEDEIF